MLGRGRSPCSPARSDKAAGPDSSPGDGKLDQPTRQQMTLRTELIDWRSESKSRHPADERSQDSLQLDACERSADAVVRAVAKCHVRVLAASDVEVAWASKHAGVDVGLMQRQQ